MTGRTIGLVSPGQRAALAGLLAENRTFFIGALGITADFERRAADIARSAHANDEAEVCDGKAERADRLAADIARILDGYGTREGS